MEDYNSYLLLSYTFVLSAKYISSTLSNHCTPIPYFTLCANRTILKYPYLLNKVQLECSSTRPLSLKARQPSRHGLYAETYRPAEYGEPYSHASSETKDPVPASTDYRKCRPPFLGTVSPQRIKRLHHFQPEADPSVQHLLSLHSVPFPS